MCNTIVPFPMIGTVPPTPRNLVDCMGLSFPMKSSQFPLIDAVAHVSIPIGLLVASNVD